MSRAISFLTGLGSGYLQGDRQRKQDERQAKLDGQNEQLFTARMSELNDAKEGRDKLRAAVAPAKILEDNTVVDDAGNPTSKPMINGTYYSTMAEAQQAAKEYDSAPAVKMRTMTALRSTDPLKAADFEHQQTQREQQTTTFTQAQEDRFKRLKQEGVLEAAQYATRGDVDGFVRAANASGEWKIVDKPVFTPVTRDIPGLGKQTTYDLNFTVEGPDGKQEKRAFNSHELRMGLMPYEQRLKAEQEAGLKASQINENEAKATYYQSAAGAKSGAAEKLPAMVKLRAEGLQRAVGAAEAAYNKGLAGGESPESPGMQTLRKNMRAAQDELEGLISPYLPSGRPATSDVLGVGPPSPTGTAGATKAPTAPPNGTVRQISKAQQAALDKDIPSILARERNEVLQRIAAGDERANTDLAALDKEIARMDKRTAPGKTASAPRAGPSMTAVAVPVDRQAPQEPSAPANPADAAGLRLDEARKQFQQASAAAQRYGLMQRRADPAGYEKAVQAQALARSTLEQQKAEYERHLQSTAQSAAMGRYARP